MPVPPVGASVTVSPLISEEVLVESSTFPPSLPSISTSPLTDTPLSAHSGEENAFSLHKFVDILCESIGFDKTQVLVDIRISNLIDDLQFYVGITLLILLVLNTFCIWLAWTYYSPKIRAYQVRNYQRS